MVTLLDPDILNCEVKQTSGTITTNKASEGYGIPAEQFKILKGWKTQQWPQDLKSSVFISIPKKVNAKEYSNCHTIVLLSHASKVML